MNGPFKAYGQIERMKQQMHLSEMRLEQELERQRKKNYTAPQMSSLGFVWTGFRVGAGVRLNDLIAWLRNRKHSGKSEKNRISDDTEPVSRSENEIGAETAREEKNGPGKSDIKPETQEAVHTAAVSGMQICREQSVLQEMREIAEASDRKELQKAVLWAEVLGEPVSRRRRRRR